MKNFEKYKSHEEAIKGFELYCMQYHLCFDCPYRNGDCEIKWLYSEAKSKEEESNENVERNTSIRP